jgi:high-affinity iron transporter
MLGNFIIGLREGLEAALVVSILVTYLVRTERTALRRFIAYGVVAAVAASALIATKELSATVEPAFAGSVSFLAVGFVTWMIFWMKRSSRTISGELRQKLDSAAMGGALAVAAMAFLTVVREGAETAVFFWAAAHATHHEGASLVGLVLGLGVSVALGVAFFKSTLKINLPSFFKVTGILLTIVSAGVLAAGVHEFQEIGWLPGEDAIWINLGSVLPEGSVLATVVAGLFNITATTTALQVIAWVAYVVVVLTLFLRPAAVPVVSEQPAPTQQPAPL